MWRNRKQRCGQLVQDCLVSGRWEARLSSSAMHPFLRANLAGPIAIVSVAFWGAFALLVVAFGPGPKVSTLTTAVPAVDRNAEVVSLAVAEAWPVSTARSDRLPWPPRAEPEPEPAIKPA